MANQNRIILIGRLTADPETRTTMDSTPITKFSIAVDRNAMPGIVKETDFFDIIAWRKLAETSGQFLSKGQLVLVEGRIQNRSFESKDGARKYVTEIVSSNIKPLEKGAAKAATAAVEAPAFPEDTEAVDDNFLEDDLPF